MNNIKTQLTADKLAMTFSLLCVVHCFLFPSFVILTSGFLSFSIDNEFIHYLILLVAIPISIYALILGYIHHKIFSFLPIGIIGSLMLISSAVLGATFLAELEEMSLALLGAILVSYSHLKNYQSCKNLDCSCHEQ